MDNQDEARQAAIKNYLEINRWMQIGPMGETMSKVDKQVILVLGTYSKLGEELTSKFLGKVLGSQAPTISGSLDRLVEEKYVTKTQKEGDKRSSYLTLDEKGKRAYEAISIFLYNNAKNMPIDFPGLPDFPFFFF